MTDGLLTGPDLKRVRLSQVYRQVLLPVRSGYSISVPQPDRDSVDLRFQARITYRLALDGIETQGRGHGSGRAAQLMGVLRLRLSMKNYTELHIETRTPRMHVVLALRQTSVAVDGTVTMRD